VLLAASSVVGLVGRVALGALVDRLPLDRLLTVAAAVAAGAGGFGLLAAGRPAAVVVGGVAAFGAGWSWPGLFMYAVVRLREEAPAAATGVTQTGAYTGSALGPLLFGVVAEQASYGAAWLGSAALALAGAVALAVGRRLVTPPARSAPPRRTRSPA
jgi:predicted MFS family arabinose efflux permease